MSSVRVLVGTRKGAFVLTSDGTRERWDVSGPHFWCVPVGPSYRNLLPTASHVLPPSLERWITCPNQLEDCEAYSRFASAGDALRW